MLRMPLPLALLLIVLPLSGCASITLVEPERREIADGFSVHPQIEWSRFELEHIDLWTVHGPQIESLRITHGLGSGDPLLKPASRDVEMPVFESGMSANEIAEFVEDTLRRSGAANASIHDLEPGDFGSHAGFRFRISMTSESGLRYAGLAAGAVHLGRLWMVVFTAPELHYFDAYADTVEALIASVRLGAEDG